MEEDRKPQIEAAIVRIMKSRRQLDHNSIIAEVTTCLHSPVVCCEASLFSVPVHARIVAEVLPMPTLLVMVVCL